jgi:hypothetical protein
MRFTIDVEYSTHDALKDGCVALGFRRFVLIADNDVDATLIAAQWVASTGDFMPTRTHVCI